MRRCTWAIRRNDNIILAPIQYNIYMYTIVCATCDFKHWKIVLKKIRRTARYNKFGILLVCRYNIQTPAANAVTSKSYYTYYLLLVLLLLFRRVCFFIYICTLYKCVYMYNTSVCACVTISPLFTRHIMWLI